MTGIPFIVWILLSIEDVSGEEVVGIIAIDFK